MPGSPPIETYAATVAARRTVGKRKNLLGQRGTQFGDLGQRAPTPCRQQLVAEGELRRARIAGSDGRIAGVSPDQPTIFL